MLFIQRCPKKSLPAFFQRTFHRHSPSSQWPPASVLNVSVEVEEAIQNGKPVVALETTIYTHGFPYPDNITLASRLESVVRLNGGIPATIGVLNGIGRVGLTTEELIEITSAAGRGEAMKISRRDLPFITGLGITGKKINGGTTVAGTMILARIAGIEVFGTGGLGGVHRGGEVTMDISADLTELGRTPVAVISSGCKSFLDIPRTLEYLETQGVGVATFADGRTGDIDLPAFWTRESGVKSPSVVHDEKEAAAIIYARRLLNLQSGLFFANPIPLEHSIPKEEIDKSIKEAVQEAERKGVSGNANTPFILARIKDLTGGKSIPANRALIESNVARATKVAVELARLKSGETSRDTATFMPASNTGSQSRPTDFSSRESTLGAHGQAGLVGDRAKASTYSTEVDILVAGSVAIDLSCNYAPPDNTSTLPLNQTSNPAVISQSIGGVGHNVATAAYYAGNGVSVRLCSFVADDLAGKLILSSLEERGLDTSAINTLKLDGDSPARTAQYIAINERNKELVMAMADMSIIGSSNVDFTSWQAILDKSKPKWVIVDANWHESTMHQWIAAAKKAGAKVAYEPVSIAKSTKLFPRLPPLSSNSPSPECPGNYPNNTIEIATPNIHELVAMHSAAKERNYFESAAWWAVIDSLGIPSTGAGPRLQLLAGRGLVERGIPQMMIQLLPFVPTIITKLGAKGVLLISLLTSSSPLLTLPAHAPYILSRTNISNPDSDPNSASSIGGLYMRLFPPPAEVPVEEIVSVNAVGDTFLGVLIAGLVSRNGEVGSERTGYRKTDGTKRGLDVTDERLIVLAQKAAGETLRWGGGVSPRVKELAGEMGRLVPSEKGRGWEGKRALRRKED